MTCPRCGFSHGPAEGFAVEDPVRSDLGDLLIFGALAVIAVLVLVLIGAVFYALLAA